MVDVRDRPAFLRRVMFELAGNAQMSLEGDLSRCHFSQDVIVTSDETAILKRNTIAPRQDFLVLRLTSETCDPIWGQAGKYLKRVIIHVSDGHPYDDGYDGAQASGDTRHAMSEARLRGVGFICVGVTAPKSKESHDPGAALDSASALHVANISGIERQLGKLIRQALADTRRRGDHTTSAMPT